MGLTVGIVGATGMVGQVMRQLLEEREFPCDRLRLFASERSAGLEYPFRGTMVPVEPLRPDGFAGIDLILSSPPSQISKEYSPQAVAAGAVVVDNSSAFRMDPAVPLVVPEVNAAALHSHRGIIANPNCATIQLVVALAPLHRLARIKRIVMATYQSSSGKGAEALAELDQQLSSFGKQEPMPAAREHKDQLANNCLPHDWAPDEGDYTEEEIKIMRETRKILADEQIGVSVTCVRVPVRIGHSEAVNVEFHDPIDVATARSVLSTAPGVVVQDDLAAGVVPLARHAAGRDETFVGRIRLDPSQANTLNLWVVADNVRKGAATNALQIAEHLFR